MVSSGLCRDLDSSNVLQPAATKGMFSAMNRVSRQKEDEAWRIMLLPSLALHDSKFAPC